MYKSQLRRLAREHSQGKVTREAYLRRRRSLLDGITDGDIIIEREAPLVQTTQMEVFESEPTNRSQSVIYAAIGAAVFILIASMTWIFSQSGPEPAMDTPVVAPVPMPTQAPARSIVESFVAVRDWSTASVADFRHQWDGLPAADRDEARNAAWFKRLTKAMRDEIKTQKALLEFDKSGKARETGERILALADHVGAAHNLPTFPAEPTPEIPAVRATADALSPTGVAKAAIANQSTYESSEQSSTDAGTAPVSVPTPSTPAEPLPEPGTAWLAAQGDDRYTLQLFAVNGLTKVAALRKKFTDVDLKIIDHPGQRPRYRVLLGSYATVADANDAHAALPESLRGTAGQGYVKSIAGLKALGGTGIVSHLRPAPGPPENTIVAYTLQVFASNSRDNVDKLVASYPDLGLVVRDTISGGAPRYRVIFGEYASTQSAHSAAAGLPQAILLHTGKPIVKALAELDAIARRP